jgi:hypothetical protein
MIGWNPGANLSVVPSDEPDRIVICFSEFAEIAPSEIGIWPIRRGNRSPVQYIEETKISNLLKRLEWRQFPPR